MDIKVTIETGIIIKILKNINNSWLSYAHNLQRLRNLYFMQIRIKMLENHNFYKYIIKQLNNYQICKEMLENIWIKLNNNR
jgi:hypothetical protein